MSNTSERPPPINKKNMDFFKLTLALILRLVVIAINVLSIYLLFCILLKSPDCVDNSYYLKAFLECNATFQILIVFGLSAIKYPLKELAGWLEE